MMPFGEEADTLTRELQIARRHDGRLGTTGSHASWGVSHCTVREHVRRIFHKLDVTKRSTLGAILESAEFAQPRLPRL